MKMLENVEVTSAMLTSTVAEIAPSPYNSGTTYALNATASVAVSVGSDDEWTGAGQIDIYQSLQGPNTNHDPEASPTWWKRVSSVYQEYSAGTTYGLNDRVQVSTDHLVYQSLEDTNADNTPASSPTKWALVGATNRMAMFDQKLGSQTQAAEQIKVSFPISGRANSLSFLNCSAASIRYRQIAPDTTVLKDETISMVSASGINNWFAYFTNSIVRKTDVAVEDLTYLAGCTVEVTISNPGGTAKIDTLAPGQFKKLGTTVYGAQLSFVDYSKFAEDAWGNFDITERDYRKRLTADVWISADYVDEFQRLIALRRAKFTVFWGASQYGSTLIYGFPKLGDTVISYPDYSVASLTLEGLAQR